MHRLETRSQVQLRTGVNPVGFMGQECDNNDKIDVVTITRNTFYVTRYLSHCYARFAFKPLFINWVMSLTPRVT